MKVDRMIRIAGWFMYAASSAMMWGCHAPAWAYAIMAAVGAGMMAGYRESGE